MRRPVVPVPVADRPDLTEDLKSHTRAEATKRQASSGTLHQIACADALQPGLGVSPVRAVSPDGRHL